MKFFVKCEKCGVMAELGKSARGDSIIATMGGPASSAEMPKDWGVAKRHGEYVSLCETCSTVHNKMIDEAQAVFWAQPIGAV